MARRFHSRLWVRALEARNAPATFTVSNISDSGAGSLRQAVIDANNNSGLDSIQFDSVTFASYPGAIFLTTGQITISDALTISGPGNQLDVVNGNLATRILVSNASLTISGMSFTRGANAGPPSAGNGGAIYSTASLSIADCIFQSNNVSSAGGAIYQVGSSLTANHCIFVGNSASQGGCIWSTGTVSLQYCEFESPSAVSGAGVWLDSGSLNIDSCSFRGCFANTSTGKGGAVYANGAFFAQNSTFATNRAFQGGGIYLTSGGTLWNCTLAYNKASPGSGGGIYGDVTLESTIVSNNSAVSGPDVFGAVTAKNCAIGTTIGFTSFTDQLGNLPFGQNLQMESDVFAHGGLVPLVAIKATSPAKDKGSNPGTAMFDARGLYFSRKIGTAPDIGAFEVQPPPKVTVTIGDGSIQRSRITQVIVTIDTMDYSLVTAPNWQMKRVADDAAVTLKIAGGGSSGNSDSFILNFTAGPLESKSLADGVYIFTVLSANLVDGAGQHLDGNGDGIGGDDYVSPTTPGDPNRIFRLFGDGNGDGRIDLSDFAMFRLAFNPAYNSMFDFNGDGSVGLDDFGQFRDRYGDEV